MTAQKNGDNFAHYVAVETSEVKMMKMSPSSQTDPNCESSCFCHEIFCAPRQIGKCVIYIGNRIRYSSAILWHHHLLVQPPAVAVLFQQKNYACKTGRTLKATVDCV